MEELREELLESLAKVREKIARGTVKRDTLIREGVELDIPKVALATAAGLSRQAVYDILDRGLKRSGNVNTLGCGMNFSSESEIPGPGNGTVWNGAEKRAASLREEFAIFDRFSRAKAEEPTPDEDKP